MRIVGAVEMMGGEQLFKVFQGAGDQLFAAVGQVHHGVVAVGGANDDLGGLDELDALLGGQGDLFGQALLGGVDILQQTAKLLRPLRGGASLANEPLS